MNRVGVLVTFRGGSEASMGALAATNLRVEYHQNPLGLDTPQPRLSWQLEASEDAQRQTAYRILVASTPELLAEDVGDLWDSGKVDSNDTTHIAYGGSPLPSRAECHWKVQVWDSHGAESDWSAPAHWSMGLLEASDWQAAWIGYDAPYPDDGAPKPRPITFDGCAWQRVPGGPHAQGEGKTHAWRGMVEVPERPIHFARALVSSGDQFTLFVNGRKAGESDQRYGASQRGAIIDIKPFLVPGAVNKLAIEARNHRGEPGVIGKFLVEYEDGIDSLMTSVDASWKCTIAPESGWTEPGFDDAHWEEPEEVCPAHDGPWGALRNGALAPLPCPHLRTEFDVEKVITKATVYATALGIYDLHINGERVSDERFRPGWTDYTKRVYYDAYDVTDLLWEGVNAIGVCLGHGWYSGYLGWVQDAWGHYGKHPRAKVQLEVFFDDGSSEIIATGARWKANHGPILFSDFQMGEIHDARRELTAWDLPTCDDSAWQPVDVGAPLSPTLQAMPGVPVREITTLAPREVTQPEPGVHVFDFGQNLVGYARIRVKGRPGQRIRLRFAERLNRDGTLYLENLRGAACEDVYLCRGHGGEEEWEPRFTFHGFQYCEITGLSHTPNRDAVTAVVLASDTPKTGFFSCNDGMINQLVSNIEWSQRGNFLEVPTDCPQRDERLGWLGDAQVFIRTACYGMDSAAFYTKWLVDVMDAQSDEGAFPDLAPRMPHRSDGAPGWADAGVICPWELYRAYGDRDSLAACYPHMRRCVEYQRDSQESLVRTQNLHENYGDWLSIDDETNKELMATAYFAYSTRLLRDAAIILGHHEDAETFGALFEAIREAFVGAFWHDNGTLDGHSQTAYVLALRFGLLDDDKRALAAERLLHKIEERGGHLSTGFNGTAHLMPVLTDIGRTDMAYRLLHNDSFPSWGYTILHGATTMWERWDGYTEESGFQDPVMNSFNHYAFGAVGEWLFGMCAGISQEWDSAGWRGIRIAPKPGGKLTEVTARYESIRGPITSAWRIEVGRFHLECSIPPNTTGTVELPDGSTHAIQPGARAFECATGDAAS